MTKKCCKIPFSFGCYDDKNVDDQMAILCYNLAHLGGDKYTKRIMLHEAKGLWTCNLKGKVKWIDVKKGNWKKIHEQL